MPEIDQYIDENLPRLFDIRKAADLLKEKLEEKLGEILHEVVSQSAFKNIFSKVEIESYSKKKGADTRFTFSEIEINRHKIVKSFLVGIYYTNSFGARASKNQKFVHLTPCWGYASLLFGQKLDRKVREQFFDFCFSKISSQFYEGRVDQKIGAVSIDDEYVELNLSFSGFKKDGDNYLLTRDRSGIELLEDVKSCGSELLRLLWEFEHQCPDLLEDN